MSEIYLKVTLRGDALVSQTPEIAVAILDCHPAIARVRVPGSATDLMRDEDRDWVKDELVDKRAQHAFMYGEDEEGEDAV